MTSVEFQQADDDDSDRVRSTFDRADNTARLAPELAEAKREIERLRAEVKSRGEQICSLVDRKAAIRERAEAAEAKVVRVEALADEHDHCSGCPTPWWLRAALADAPAEQRAEVCGHDVGDPPEVCRCLLPRGHSGLHSCKHTQQRAERPHPKCHDDRCAGMPPCLSCDSSAEGDGRG
jgi:hypothetical protein